MNAAPIPMLLLCPACGARHIDQGEFATKSHRDHACQHCGMVWRPALVPTVGVRFLPGYKDGEPSGVARTTEPTDGDWIVRVTGPTGYEGFIQMSETYGQTIGITNPIAMKHKETAEFVAADWRRRNGSMTYTVTPAPKGGE